jgi:hypothetical protein
MAVRPADDSGCTRKWSSRRTLALVLAGSVVLWGLIALVAWLVF